MPATLFFFPRQKLLLFNKGAFKYYVIMILTFFDPPTLSSDVIISYSHLKHDVIISSYPPTHLFIDFFFYLINKAKIRQGLFLLYIIHNP